MPQLNKNEVANIFKSFGMKPSDTEIGMFEGIDYVGGGSAIANYVNTKTEQMKAEANNPLKLFIEEEKARRTKFEQDSSVLYDQLQKTISAAPKLFGSLTPDQIASYIAPIAQATREGSAQLEGDFGRRGLVGSSVEANALTDAQRKFQENVLQQGLMLGLNEQQTAANAIQNRLQQLFGAATGTTSLLGTAASGLTGQQFNNLQSITQLPLFLQAANQQLIANKKASEGPTGLGSWIGDANQALDFAANVGKLIAAVPTGGASLMIPTGGASRAGGTGGLPSPAGADAMNSAGSTLLPKSLSLI